MRHLGFCLPFIMGCYAIDPVSDENSEQIQENPLPDFTDDCDEGTNDTMESVAGLVATDGETYADIQLCDDDTDNYRIDIPPESWVSLEMLPDGGGAGSLDLDLFEVDSTGAPTWQSATEQEYERLAWYNPGAEETSRFVSIVGYQGATNDYTLNIRVQEFHDGLDCDDHFEGLPTDTSGPCNEILQFPAHNEGDGYFIEHPPHYSNLRREVIYLVRYAAYETQLQFADTNPIATLDMSERDGSTPGTMYGQLRHPEGTHVSGNDIDIAYYQTGADNAGRPVCTNDGYFCTGEPGLLDAPRSAYFLAMLMRSDHVRVIGVDPKIATAVFDAADELYWDEVITWDDTRNLDGYLAYGSGWPFHHHHLHFSWDWESGHELASSAAVDGCMVGEELNPMLPFDIDPR